MGLYNFKPRFVPFILGGTKTHTIRAIRANPDKPGNTIHCYTGLRRKGAKLIGRFECTKVEEIQVYWDWGTSRSWKRKIVYVKIDGLELERDEKEALARRDGFSDFKEMVQFWEGRLPFTGHIIHWRKDGPNRP